MSLLLNIDTATEAAHVSIARDGIVIEQAINTNQTNHAGFLQVAIKDILNKANVGFTAIDAVAVTIGPGSYTGLRVGLASAKGLCYALNKPLISIGTLAVLAKSALNSSAIISSEVDTLLCPMIDARRMEVFTAVFDHRLCAILPPCALVIDETSFIEMLEKNNIAFFGNGSKKWQDICHHKNAVFIDTDINSIAMSQLAQEKYQNEDFSDLAYTEPSYIKEFYFNTI
ncbi:MAG TPA: tRNA (adenosine(37)-N6)-threonylcarbamoyltransferase complex dimerization subunit type 1 TsaB [Ferruginibacter sp.]|jgi:tRNA threonylcarbamoyladenosine biosynthesis protein TsaB|nr:tRNA (adenosine(37)-N6)-threonylcarbamoyltransferase complex dimerization subunit type 1 TsaB [Ferruginibacter sp.]